MVLSPRQCAFSEAVAVSTAFAEVRDVDAAVELLHRAQAASGGMVEAFELIPADIMHVYLRPSQYPAASCNYWRNECFDRNWQHQSSRQ